MVQNPRQNEKDDYDLIRKRLTIRHCTPDFSIVIPPAGHSVAAVATMSANTEQGKQIDEVSGVAALSYKAMILVEAREMTSSDRRQIGSITLTRPTYTFYIIVY